MAVTGGGPAGGGEEPGPYAAVKSSVWWDIENCQVPRGSDAHVIAQNISSALADVGYEGAVTISAYGDTNRIPAVVQHALSSTGVALNHVPAGYKDASDKKILVDMLFWAVDNPPPANYLLISGDRDFSNALHQLRMRRYNILLAHAPSVSQALVAAASRVWLWTSLLAGGPPLQNSVSSCNASGGSNSCSEKGKKTIRDPSPSNGSYTRNEDNSLSGRTDSHSKSCTPVWRNQTLPTGDVSRTSGLPESRDGHGLQFQKQMSMLVISSSQAHGSTHLKHATASSAPYSSIQMPPRESGVSSQSEGKIFNKAPHEFFGASKPMVSVGFSNQPSHPGGPITNVNISNNDHTQYSQPIRMNMPPPLPSHSSSSHNFGSYLPPNQQAAPSFTPVPPSDFNRLMTSKYPSNVYQNVLFPPQNSGPPDFMQNSWPFYQENAKGGQLNAGNGNISYNGNQENTGSQMSSGVIQGLIGNILVALYQLKANKIIPTVANIADCIRYGMGIQNFNVNMALNSAVEQNVVVMRMLGNLSIYIGRDDKLWKCINPLDSNIRHPEAAWDTIRNFLSSAHGQSAVSSTECRYHAATVLKKECLEHLALGDILQILHVIVQVKKWIIHSSHSWQPLSFSLKVASDSHSGDCVSTEVQSEDK